MGVRKGFFTSFLVFPRRNLISPSLSPLIGALEATGVSGEPTALQWVWSGLLLSCGQISHTGGLPSLVHVARMQRVGASASSGLR